MAKKHGDHDRAGHIAEAPLAMVVPLLIVAAGLVAVGIYAGDIVAHIIEFAIPGSIL